MEALNKDYAEQLEAIAKEIQGSQELANFLDTEEEEDFQILRDHFEPKISAVYQNVAEHHPLQLLALEKMLLDESYEGLFMPRILGFAVLRGELSANYKYLLPPDHFEEILKAMANSSNFDYLKMRTGQTIQIGFALSSDIWVTNFINSFTNRRIRYFFQSQKLDKYRDMRYRAASLSRYRRQFKKDNFASAVFPSNKSELKTLFPALKSFIKTRIKAGLNNENVKPQIVAFIDNDSFKGGEEYIYMMGLYTMFFNRDEANEAHLKSIFNEMRKGEGFTDQWFELVRELYDTALPLGMEADMRVKTLLDESITDDLNAYYDLMETLHTKGYVHEDTIEETKEYYQKREGLSLENENVRQAIFAYFNRILSNIDETEYSELFELGKIFPVYMNIFGNQLFNQRLKEVCMAYVRKLLKKYSSDKRGKDYQDIKRFVSTNFTDFGWLKEKEVTELFKTRRKKKAPTS